VNTGRVEGKVAIVAGGALGIGRAACELLSRIGRIEIRDRGQLVIDGGYTAR
jgi:NAD(P)-dependent dehydrogenase (short-subunit alcohol dehydrogenase family)